MELHESKSRSDLADWEELHSFTENVNTTDGVAQNIRRRDEIRIVDFLPFRRFKVSIIRSI